MCNWHNSASDHPDPTRWSKTSFSDAEFASKKKRTRRERFLAEIEAAMPWPVLVPALLTYHPKGNKMGFVNEVIQDQDRHLVDLQRLYSPYGHATFEFTEWCIDHERKAVFIYVPSIGRYGQVFPMGTPSFCPEQSFWLTSSMQPNRVP